jgi:hypothetical protein
MLGQEYFDAEDIAVRVIPALGPCLIDAEEDVRAAAFKSVAAFVQVRVG